MTPKLKKLTAGIGGAALLSLGAATVPIVPTETTAVVWFVREDGCFAWFQKSGGAILEESMSCEDYWKIAQTPDYPQPEKTVLRPLLAPDKTNAAVVFDATANSADQADVSSFSYSHTNTGANLVLYVGVSMQDTTDAERDVTSITYNSVELSEVRRQNNNTFDLTAEIWRLVNPSTGKIRWRSR